MSKHFDLVAIGTGAAGSTVAMKCRKAGWNVAVVDSLPCALRGCDPKKVLIDAAEALDWVQRLDGKGIRDQVRVEYPTAASDMLYMV
jgi:glutathione reductase (NADPH)